MDISSTISMPYHSILHLQDSGSHSEKNVRRPYTQCIVIWNRRAVRHTSLLISGLAFKASLRVSINQRIQKLCSVRFHSYITHFPVIKSMPRVYENSSCRPLYLMFLKRLSVARISLIFLFMSAVAKLCPQHGTSL